MHFGSLDGFQTFVAETLGTIWIFLNSTGIIFDGIKISLADCFLGTAVLSITVDSVFNIIEFRRE